MKLAESSLYKTGLIFLAAICLIIASCSNESSNQSPEKLPDSLQRLAKNAIKGLKIHKGLQATLFASEPMITNPTNMDIDARGRVWLCEGFNYRPQFNPGDSVNPKGDQIVILEDADGDGRADTCKVFYQGPEVNAALGICVLGNKVIVSCSPKVFVFTDTDGDDKADKKEILFEGVGGFQHDHGIHAFTFGPDGKLYFNFGNAGDSILDRNGNIVRDPDGNAVNNHGEPYRQGMVFRCNTDGSNLEVLGHNFRNPYEVAIDAFGNLWQSDNDDDGNRSVRINYVMKYGNYGYTDELTGAGWNTPRVNMEDSIPFRHWHLNDPGAVPNLLQTGAGAPTGMVIYEGSLLPKVFRNQIIHADALPNVVRSYPVRKSGAGYTAGIVNIVEGVYDKWFRPSDVCVAPDGSLFISDWYDPGVGGHQVGDLVKGRVFRIAPNDKYHIAPPILATPSDAVKALQNPNLATRYLAWEKLHAWGDKSIPALEKMYHSDNPRFRARALWLLSKLPGKGMKYIETALKDDNEDIRITAIRAARELPVDIVPVIRQVVHDHSAQVRRTAAIALHHQHTALAADLWGELANQYDGKDRWYLEALGIGADKQWDSFFAAWLKKNADKWNTAAGRDIIWRSRANAALPLLAEIIENPKMDPEKNLKFFRAFDFHPKAASQQVLLTLLEGHHPKQDFINAFVLLQLNPEGQSDTKEFHQLISRSMAQVKGRREFVALAKKYGMKAQDPALLQLVLLHRGDELGKQALAALLDLDGRDMVLHELYADTLVSASLIDMLGHSGSGVNKDILQTLVLDKKYDLSLRKKAIYALGEGWDGKDRLMRLIDENKLPVEMDSVTADVLLRASREEIRKKATAYFHLDKKEKNTLPPVDKLVSLKGNPSNGKIVFRNFCAACHRVNGNGTDFGPDLSEIGGKLAKDAIYKSIITPDAGISFGYEGYLFKLKNGKRITGYITSETPEEVGIKIMGGAIEKVPAKEIISREKNEHSLMPTGLATAMSENQLVDLVTYLSALKKRTGK